MLTGKRLSQSAGWRAASAGVRNYLFEHLTMAGFRPRNGFTFPPPVTYKDLTMSDAAASPTSGTNKPFPLTPKPFAPEDEAALREALKRCSPSAFEAAVQFRKTGNPEHVPAVVIGVID